MILKVSQIGKKFGGLTALDNVSFSINSGEIYGVIGPNGAGKTTLFNVITSLLAPSTGKVSFNNKALNALKLYQVNKLGISRTFQNIKLFPNMTSIENIMVGQHSKSKSNIFQSVFRTKFQQNEEQSIKEKSFRLLELVGLEKEYDKLSSELSYGQQRRLEIARALASDPKLLLLDEPAAGMNETETEELFLLIKKIQKLNITIMLIEHDMKLVMKVCDRLLVLNFGKKIAEGKPIEIQNNNEVIEAYLGKMGD
jgi:branched-chain amino acid transport system ATP-binding protein